MPSVWARVAAFNASDRLAARSEAAISPSTWLRNTSPTSPMREVGALRGHLDLTRAPVDRLLDRIGADRHLIGGRFELLLLMRERVA